MAPSIRAACSPGEVRVAVVTGGRLTDYAIWRPGRTDGVGDLHRGRITARVRGLGGSFVALGGSGPEGFLPDSEAPPDVGVGEILTVQVTRAAQSGKGPRLTRRPGPANDGGEGPVGLLQRGPGAVERLAALFPDAEVAIDDVVFVPDLRPVLGKRLRLVPRAFDAALEDDVATLHACITPLPGGGTMHIQPTAALVAIDVDSGAALSIGGAKNSAHRDFNLAAIPEIARQIRLRNLSGAILVDLAGLSPKHRARFAGTIQAVLEQDPVETRFVGFTGLGLAEIVRRRIHPPLHELLSGPHAAIAAALRAAIAGSGAGSGGARSLLRCAPDLAAAYEQDAVMRDGLARSAAHTLMVRSDPRLEPGKWELHEMDMPPR